MTNRDVFERVVRAWLRQPDPSKPLTFNQLASISLGVGNPKNTSRVALALHEYRPYFKLPEMGGYRCTARWDLLRRDHSQFFVKVSAGQASAVENDNRDAVGGMLTALAHELAAVREQNERRPIKAYMPRPFEIGVAACAYEVTVELPGEEELPIPEGVRLRLRWPRRHIMEGELLAYDPPRSTVILQVPSPIPPNLLHVPFEILPCVEDLIEAVMKRLRQLNPEGRFVKQLLTAASAVNSVVSSVDLQGTGLDFSQAAAVKAGLNQELTFIWGPPGTGKTHTLARLITAVALSDGLVLGISIANVAVDQLALQVVAALEHEGAAGLALLEQGRVLRFGHPRLPEVTGERRLFPHEEMSRKLRRELDVALRALRDAAGKPAEHRASLQALINDRRQQMRQLMKTTMSRARIILTTAVQTCVEDLFSELQIDTLVVDEASMMPIPHLITAAALPRRRLVIVGDFRQLGPVALAKSHAAHKWLHRDAFALMGIGGTQPEHAAMRMLTGQRRMHPDICALVSDHFYGGRLETLANKIDLKGIMAAPQPGSAAVFVSLEGDAACRVQQTSSGSRVNVRSAAVVVALAQRLLEEPHVRSVGLIAPYRAQAQLIRAAIRELPLSQTARERVRVGTVHAFQGAEFDVIVWDLVDTSHHSIGQLYREEAGDRLTNVAISRAKSKLILVGVRSAFWEATAANTVGHLRRILRSSFGGASSNEVSAAELGL